ncbi:hypothetical protein D0S48_11765 [Psychrobacillus sp. AK 1817]|nr:hypothetical protein D0S48_11765 [Psychrobacillus sp. AK 1817]
MYKEKKAEGNHLYLSKCTRKQRGKEFEEARKRGSERIAYARTDRLRVTKKSATHLFSQPKGHANLNPLSL